MLIRSIDFKAARYDCCDAFEHLKKFSCKPHEHPEDHLSRKEIRRDAFQVVPEEMGTGTRMTSDDRYGSSRYYEGDFGQRVYRRTWRRFGGDILGPTLDEEEEKDANLSDIAKDVNDEAYALTVSRLEE